MGENCPAPSQHQQRQQQAAVASNGQRNQPGSIQMSSGVFASPASRPGPPPASRPGPLPAEQPAPRPLQSGGSAAGRGANGRSAQTAPSRVAAERPAAAPRGPQQASHLQQQPQRQGLGHSTLQRAHQPWQDAKPLDAPARQHWKPPLLQGRSDGPRTPPTAGAANAGSALQLRAVLGAASSNVPAAPQQVSVPRACPVCKAAAMMGPWQAVCGHEACNECWVKALAVFACPLCRKRTQKRNLTRVLK